MNRTRKDRSVLSVLMTAIGPRQTDGGRGVMGRHRSIGALRYPEFDSEDTLQALDFSLSADTRDAAAV